MKSVEAINKYLNQLRNDYKQSTISQVKHDVRVQIEMLEWVLKD